MTFIYVALLIACLACGGFALLGWLYTARRQDAVYYAVSDGVFDTLPDVDDGEIVELLLAGLASNAAATFRGPTAQLRHAQECMNALSDFWYRRDTKARQESFKLID